MTSLVKQPNLNLCKKQTNYISSKGFDKAIQKFAFYWIWAIVSKVMSIMSNFAVYTHQIWSCHMTQVTIKKKNNFGLILN